MTAGLPEPDVLVLASSDQTHALTDWFANVSFASGIPMPDDRLERERIMKDQSTYIQPSQLCIGLYVHLDLSWMNHPFTFGNFKITSKEQIQKIRELNLNRIRYDPARSDYEPLPLAAPVPTLDPAPEIVVEKTPVAKPDTVAEIPPTPRTPQQRSERLKQLNTVIRICEKAFVQDARTTRELVHNLPTQPQATIKAATALVDTLVNSAVTEPDIVLHAVSGNNSSSEDHVHALNVTVLALMLAKSLDMTDAYARELGMAALFHDVSKSEIPRHKTFIDQHCENSARMAREAGLADGVVRVIMQHHEHVDGTGFPKHLVAAQIDPLAKVLAIVNAYDNLCNPFNPLTAMTPYEALAHMYATDHNKYDATILKLLIKMLGVYPPGSVVQLSNGIYGIVMTVNPQKPLLPLVRIHHPSVSRETPVVIDLSEENGLSIKKCMRPSQLPKEVYDYLRPCKHVSYYFMDKKLVDQPLPGIVTANAPPATESSILAQARQA
ncbi:HD domain-containing phosphohydrolase [Methylobacillus sp. MM3]|uniref:HD-GYP domain-containing protein n=1 Tax=Methylobacillus sp. MM3 TaxID=1848039 RepID=UPI000ABEC0F4|nr:HD domain-containing phosphohydrolase [Methylobacillus sp. MM3]